MARPQSTESVKVFKTNLERSRAFLRIFDKDRKQGQPTNDEKELLRGCLVFAVGALDAYLSDLILEIVPEYAVKSKSLDDALNQIAKTNPGMILRLTLTQESTDRRTEFKAALGEWLENKSFQGPEKVVVALGYLGCRLSWDDFDKSTNVNSAQELKRITDERHSIVHRGQKPYIKRQLADEAVALIENMVKLIDARVLEVLASA